MRGRLFNLTKVLPLGLFLILFPIGCTSVEEPEDAAPIEQVEIPTEIEIEPEPELPPQEVIEGEDFFSGLVEPFSHNWYVKHLKAMGEDPLAKSEPVGGLKFRFLWLRTFDEPYMVRGFMGADNKIKLHMRGLDGTGGWDPGQKIHDTFSNLTTGQTEEILSQLKTLDICQAKDVTISGRDGAQWIFEIIDNNQYCLVDFWSPKEGSKFREIGIHLLKTSRVKTWEINVY